MSFLSCTDLALLTLNIPARQDVLSSFGTLTTRRNYAPTYIIPDWTGLAFSERRNEEDRQKITRICEMPLSDGRVVIPDVCADLLTQWLVMDPHIDNGNPRVCKSLDLFSSNR